MNIQDKKTTNKVLIWFVGALLLPPISWLISAWFFDVWNTEEMLKILFRLNIPVYVIIWALIIYFIIKKQLKNITSYIDNPKPENENKALRSARFIPRFFMLILPIYTTVGDFPVLLPLDFIDKTEFILGITIGVPVVLIFAIPFFITMNSHLDKLSAKLPISDKYKPMNFSSKISMLFLFSIIGSTILYISGIIGVMHNNTAENLSTVLVSKLLIASLVIIALSLFNSAYFKKQISNLIQGVNDNMRQISEGEGDLTKRLEVKTRDEIGQLSYWFNKFINNIEEIIVNIDKIVLSLSNAGNQLSSISEQISENANTQAATTEEVAASMEQMVATIISNTTKAEDIENFSTKSANEIKISSDSFEQTIKSVSEINKKISIISEIADKTDILSINAAIESARAGDSGKGFAVVAQEIRKLADKTKIASDEINNLSAKGENISKIAEEKLSKTVHDIITSAQLVNQIVIASKEQQNGIEAINNSVQQLTEITNQNSASAEEMSASAEELSTQAQQLKSLISTFKIK